MTNDFGKILKEKRKKRCLTQKEFAEELGVSLHSVRNWETNLNEPSLSFLVWIADFFDCSLDELVGREDREFTKHPPTTVIVNGVEYIRKENEKSGCINNIKKELSSWRKTQIWGQAK